MGSAWSMFQSTKTCDINQACNAPAKGLAAGAAGAGIGTFSAFFVTAIITILLALCAIISQWRDGTNTDVRGMSKERRRHIRHIRRKDRHVLEQVILSFSDQQLVTGLAMAVTTRYFVNCDLPLSAYHYDIICYLLLCSVVTHLCSIVAVNHYFYPFTQSTRATISRATFLAVRCLGMAVTIILTGLILLERDQNRFPVNPPASADVSDKLLLQPAACFFMSNVNVTTILDEIPDVLGVGVVKDWTHGLTQFVIFVLAIIIAVPLAILHSLERGFCSRKPPVRFILCARLAVVLTGAGVLAWNLTLALQLRNFMHNSGWLDEVASAEKAWTFGQMLSVLILLFAPFAAMNAAAEKYDTKHALSGRASGHELVASGKDGYEFVGAD